MNIYGQLVAIRVQNKDFWLISANFFPNQKPTQQTKLRLNNYEILERPEDLEDHHPVHHHRAHRHHQLVLRTELQGALKSNVNSL